MAKIMMRINIPTSYSFSVGELTERRDDVEGDKVVEEDFKEAQATLSCPNMYSLQFLHFGLDFPDGV
jgi:hypothetical protein